MKPFAIIASIIIVAVCVIYGIATNMHWSESGPVDLSAKETLNAGDNLRIDSSISGILLSADPEATEVTASLQGQSIGIGSQPKLRISRMGSLVTVRAWRDGINFSSGTGGLHVTIPANFAGELNCHCSAGGISITSDLSLKSLKVDSSAGPISIENVNAENAITVISSAGCVETGALKCSSADLSSSAGYVSVEACAAGRIRLHSSAGSVTAKSLSGDVDASSSAGPVDIEIREIAANVRATSSAGNVQVTIPANANADIDLSSLAGSASADNLDLRITAKNNGSLRGTLGSGGSRIYLHSSAGPVELIGK